MSAGATAGNGGEIDITLQQRAELVCVTGQDAQGASGSDDPELERIRAVPADGSLPEGDIGICSAAIPWLCVLPDERARASADHYHSGGHSHCQLWRQARGYRSG